MAAWEELVLACDLKPDVPEQVINILKYLIGEDSAAPSEPIPVPEHQFFSSDDHWWMFLLQHTYYFPGEPLSKFALDKNSKQYKFTTRSMIKAGQFQVMNFVHWLAPYSETKGFVGYTRCDEIPDWLHIIYFEEGSAYYRSIQWNEEADPIEVEVEKKLITPQ
jgi:hypothetical protein